jgi:glyoxylase-like metal-dependent hydrolase (beta-lactamase superfamily II)
MTKHLTEASGLRALARIASLLLALAAGAVHAQPQSNAAAPADPFVLKQIGPGVYAAIDGPQGRSGSNAGFVIGDNGVLVVDSFFNPEATKALVADIRKITPKPIRYVVNTHYHIDHVSGDGVLRDAGAIIIAHRNVRGWLHVNNINLLGKQITPALRAQIAALADPDLVTDKPLTVWLGSRRVDVRPVEGHTGGDLAISVPDANVLFCGDLLWRKYPPNIIDGTVSKWIATVTEFQQLPNASAMTFVPGHGEVANLHDVAEFDAYLTELSADVAAGRAAGLTGKELANAVVPKLKARFGDWEYIDQSAPIEVGYMDAELAGTKQVPIPTGD